MGNERSRDPPPQTEMEGEARGSRTGPGPAEGTWGRDSRDSRDEQRGHRGKLRPPTLASATMPADAPETGHGRAKIGPETGVG